jgi:predicted anti-sigma-YlaC factor YlaD
MEIAAWLDGSSDPKTVSRLRHHLDTCSSCLSFYREQSQLNALLGSRDLELEPPQHLWYRIESRMGQRQEVSRWQAFLASLAQFWIVPQLRYAVITSLILLVGSLSLLEIRTNRAADQVLLARIDACQLKVEGNPFLSGLEKVVPSENPFISLGASTSNPFKSKGSRQ